MGAVGTGATVQTFVGESTAVGDDDKPETLDVAKLNEALQSAAAQAIAAGVVSKGKTAWVRISFLDVELANQHPKTVRVGVTPIGP